MSTWEALLIVAAVLAVGLMALFLWLGAGHLPSGRAGRLARIGRMSAALSASWFGAKVRRLFTGKHGRERIDAARRTADAKRVAETMGQMKGAFMKLGQMMSFISDELPEEYRAALKGLQADAPPMDFALVRDTVERELGKPLERAFAMFEEKPLAAASIGQVHAARLPHGEEVVVKVQYPGVADAIRSDLANAAMLYQMLKMMYPAYEPKPVVEELRGRIFEEFDYQNERANLEEFGRLYDGHPFIKIPRVFPAHTTSTVLTTERIFGKRFDEVCADASLERRSRYAEIIYRFVFGSIMRYRLFNGDPHPGNYLFEDDKVVFLDFGCVKRFPEEMARDWTGLVASHFSGDHAAFRGGLVRLGFLKEDSPLDAERLYEYFGVFYEPFRYDRDFKFSREYIASTFKQVFAPGGKFAGMQKQLNMPGHFVFVNRIQWGVFSILGHLGAHANYHRIHREYLYGEPAATELGRMDEEHYRKKGVKHGRAAAEEWKAPPMEKPLGATAAAVGAVSV
jgi:predicted unusual protein kinase regulating ubiquinone biosynthesis (AarF/ABC1/UbiB family)